MLQYYHLIPSLVEKKWHMGDSVCKDQILSYLRGIKAIYPAFSLISWLDYWIIKFLAHPHASPTPYHIPFQFSPFFYFPCQNALVRKLPNYSHSLCTCTPDSGLGLSRMSNTGNFRYHKYWVSQEPVMQTLAIHISMESYWWGESIYDVGIEV